MLRLVREIDQRTDGSQNQKEGEQIGEGTRTQAKQHQSRNNGQVALQKDLQSRPPVAGLGLLQKLCQKVRLRSAVSICLHVSATTVRSEAGKKRTITRVLAYPTKIITIYI